MIRSVCLGKREEEEKKARMEQRDNDGDELCTMVGDDDVHHRPVLMRGFYRLLLS